jgi:hypothetical protein
VLVEALDTNMDVGEGQTKYKQDVLDANMDVGRGLDQSQARRHLKPEVSEESKEALDGNISIARGWTESKHGGIRR